VGSAASEGHLQVVKYLVEEAGADDNRKNEDIWTPLMAAADKGQAAVVAYLLGRPDTNINAKDDDAYTALDRACRGRHVEVVKLLVEAGARLEVEASGEVRALGSAAWGGSLQIVKYLVEEVGVDERLADRDGWTSLICAAEGGHADIVAYLLDRRGTDIDAETEGPRALDYAFEGGHLEVVKLLVAAGVRLKAPAGDGMGTLASAACKGHVQVVKYLVEEAGADENRGSLTQLTPLMWAAVYGHTNVVAYLLGRPGIDINAKTGPLTALNIACQTGHLKVVKLLVAAGARLYPQSSDEVGALASAALAGKLKVVKYLVEEVGADENRAGPDGVTPLIYAANARRAKVVAYLLGRPRIDINAKTGQLTALTVACCAGRLNVVKLLVTAGARLYPQGRDEMGALQSAAFKGKLKVVKYLVEEAGVDENRADPDGLMPLMYAADKGHTGVVAYLLGRPGININAKRGRLTALNIACLVGRLNVVKLLVAAGARLEAQASDEMGALASAAWGGQLEVVKYLVEEAGADENRADPGGLTPLICAAGEGHADVVAYLLSRPGINSDAKTNQLVALIIACQNGHLRVVQVLLEATGRQGLEERDRLGRTALHQAVASVNKELVAFLLSKGAQASTKDTHKQETPLMLACSGGKLDMVQVLLKHTGGFLVSERNSEGRTALHLAATSSANGLSSDMVRVLLLAGADPSITDNEGRTPRQAAQQDAEHSACVETFEVRAQVHLAVSDVR
jgi:ankyrin repeat protein